MKKIFENAVWWSGVIMVGLVLGVSLQFVRAWTEPTAAPPDGNVGAPLNTGIIEQLKQGALGINGLLKLYGGLQVPTSVVSGTPQPGYVLTAQSDPSNPAISNGQAAWAPGGGGVWYVPTTVKVTTAAHQGNFGGYDGMYNWIQDNGCAGYHVCDQTELSRYAQLHGGKSIPRGWYQNGMAASPSGSNTTDCEGWTSGGEFSYGQYWQTEGFPYGIRCDSGWYVLCCK